MPRKFTEEEFRAAVASNHSIHATLLTLGVCAVGGSYRTFHNAVKRWGVNTSHFRGQGWAKGKPTGVKFPITAYLSNERPAYSNKLKRRLLTEGILSPECANCKITIWCGQPAPLELDHIDGKHNNNLLENLRLLCPNCHAQTPTYCGKNIGKC